MTTEMPEEEWRAGMAWVTCGRWREFTGLLSDSVPAPAGDPLWTSTSLSHSARLN